MMSRRWTTSNQRWNNVAYVKVEIYNVEQLRINIIYFDVDFNNVRQHRNNVIFNVDFCNLRQRRNNVVNMKIFKKLKNKLWDKNIKIFLSFKQKSFKLNILNSKFSSLCFPFQGIYIQEYFQIRKNS